MSTDKSEAVTFGQMSTDKSEDVTFGQLFLTINLFYFPVLSALGMMLRPRSISK